MKVRLIFILLLIFISPVVFIASLCIGPTKIELDKVFSALLGNSEEKYEAIVVGVRLPRIIAVYLVGVALSTAGTMTQAVFRNPLGDPYILGISSGASLGAVLSFIYYPRLTPVFAFIFAIIVTFVVYNLASIVGGSPNSIVLAGIAIGMLINAIVLYLLLYIKELHGVYAWLHGSFSSIKWTDVYVLLPIIPISFISILTYKWLNMLLLSDDEALSLGLDVKSARMIIIFIAALLTATSVAVAGLISFVGLVVPHISRLIVGGNHKYLLPSAMLFGGIFLLVADNIARCGWIEIPIGIVTAILGSPLFIYLLVRRHASS